MHAWRTSVVGGRREAFSDLLRPGVRAWWHFRAQLGLVESSKCIDDPLNSLRKVKRWKQVACNLGDHHQLEFGETNARAPTCLCFGVNEVDSRWGDGRAKQASILDEFHQHGVLEPGMPASGPRSPLSERGILLEHKIEVVNVHIHADDAQRSRNGSRSRSFRRPPGAYGSLFDCRFLDVPLARIMSASAADITDITNSPAFHFLDDALANGTLSQAAYVRPPLFGWDVAPPSRLCRSPAARSASLAASFDET